MGNFNKSRGCSTEQIMESINLKNPPNYEIPLILHGNKQEIMQTHHATYNKIGLAKASTSSTLHTAVRCFPRYLVGIGLFDSFVIQG